MKAFVWHVILFSFANCIFSQNNIPTTKTIVNELNNERWDLNKYVWSYTHNTTVKKDKAGIDFDAIDNWEGLGRYLSISNNGKYFAYTLERGMSLPNRYRRLDSLKVQCTSDSWCKGFAKAKPGFFTADNKQYVFQVNDTLCFLQLGTQKCKTINNIESYKVAEDRNDWVAYKFKSSNLVVLLNLLTGKEKHYSDIASYSFDNSKKWFVCESNYPKELYIYNLDEDDEHIFSSIISYLFSPSGNSLLIYNGNQFKYFDSRQKSLTKIWATEDTSVALLRYKFDESGTQIVFTVRNKLQTISTNSIWYYRQGMDKAIMKGSNELQGIPSDLQIQENISFTDNNHYIHLILERKPAVINARNGVVQLDVWNYKDLNLQSTQPYLSSQSKIYNGFINIENGHLETVDSGEDESLVKFQGDFAIVKKSIKSDRFWEKGLDQKKDSYWLVSIKEGGRHVLLNNGGNDLAFWFSPGGNYLVYFDTSKACHYFSYNLRKKNVKDISPNLQNGELGIVNGYPFSLTDEKPVAPFGLAGWLQNDAGLLVYDNNDIWKLDLEGDNPAINVTNYYGRKNYIIFSLMNSGRFTGVIPVLKEKESILLRAFDSRTKYNGFYRKNAFFTEDPELLSMRPYFMHAIPWIQDPNLSKDGLQPMKARKSSVWIVQQQSTADAPNYYTTVDFKSFKRLTDFQPQKKYYWLSEELHHFNHLDGRIGEGILYKPENFDPSKKYPVLIIFYGEYSNNLYQFPIPAFNNDAITPGESPNWFLNNGYLVFTPNINVEPLRYGPEAFNVIEGAARYLKQLPYIDTTKLGFGAHSWSAKLGSYIFTHSNSFAAVGMSEGFLYANMLNVAFSTDENGISKLNEVENGFQYGNLWKNKDSWLDQTTILNVDKAKGPLLLLCNKESTKEYQDQTLQLFIALRRLDKEVWWLKYDKGDHVLWDLSEIKDFSIRYTQFFDHYLKEAPAPRWMTLGIPYALRGVESRYDLDPSGKCGKDCKICGKWNQQYNKHPEMFEKATSEWHLPVEESIIIK